MRWHPRSLLGHDDTAPSPDGPHRETGSSSFPRFRQGYMQSSSLEVETREKSNLVRKSLHITERFLVLSFPLSAKHRSHMLKLPSIPSAGYFPKALEQSLKYAVLCQRKSYLPCLCQCLREDKAQAHLKDASALGGVKQAITIT